MPAGMHDVSDAGDAAGCAGQQDAVSSGDQQQAAGQEDQRLSLRQAARKCTAWTSSQRTYRTTTATRPGSMFSPALSRGPHSQTDSPS